MVVHTGVSKVLLVLLSPDLGMLEVFVFDFYKLDHFGLLCEEKIELGCLNVVFSGCVQNEDLALPVAGCGSYRGGSRGGWW